MKNRLGTIAIAVIVNAAAVGCGEKDNSISVESQSLRLETLPVTDGLVGFWNFAEGTGTTAHDSSGNGNDGTVNGARWEKNADGTHLVFNGIDNYVEVPYDASLDSPGSFTIAAWAKSDVADYQNEEAFIMDMGFGAERRYALSWHPIPGARGDYCASTIGTQAVDITRWHHYAMTYDGTTQRFYIDAKLIGETAVAPGSIDDLPLRIGSESKQLYRFWKGRIDSVAIYNRGLSASEVRLIEEAGCPAPSAAFTYEIENQALENYKVLESREASGGKYTAITAATAKATIRVTDPSDTYNLTLTYFDQANGQTQFTMDVGGTIIKAWTANNETVSSVIGPVTRRTLTVPLVSLTRYSSITIRARRNGAELAALDKLVLSRGLQACQSPSGFCGGMNTDNNYLQGWSTGHRFIAMKYVASATLTVNRVEVFTSGAGIPSNTLGIYTNNATTNSPTTPLAPLVDWAPVGTTPTWQGTDLAAPVVLTAGSTYWIIWHPGDQQTSPLAETGPTTEYRGSDDGVTWDGPYVRALKVGLSCAQ